MQLLANMHRPLTALILLAAACSSREETYLTAPVGAVGASSSSIEGDAGPAPSPGGEIPVPACDAPAHDAGAVEPPPASADAGSVEPPPPPPPPADAGSVAPEPTCGNGVVDPGEACDLGSENGGDACDTDCTVPPPPAPALGACLSCAQATCPDQFANALGATSDEANFAAVSQLLACVVGADWQGGAGIPATSCFFADPTQPAGSMVPCYCGSTPTATCLATGPSDHSQACAGPIEVASGCQPATASCVTTSGSSPNVALGDVLQLFNCERVACQAECGFPAPIEE